MNLADPLIIKKTTKTGSSIKPIKNSTDPIKTPAIAPNPTIIVIDLTEAPTTLEIRFINHTLIMSSIAILVVSISSFFQGSNSVLRSKLIEK